VFGIPIEFILFGLTLAGVAVFHQFTLRVAVFGLLAVTAFKLGFTEFDLVSHLGQEWRLQTNLLGLLLGFAVLARHFEDSRIPEALPRWLPSGAPGGFVLLALVFVLSTFLDNIAAAMIGATMARVVFKHRVHIGYLAAIVACSNAGGAGSVIGDTTTTMMWIDGVAARNVLEAFIGSGIAAAITGFIATRQQFAHQPIAVAGTETVKIDWLRVGIVLSILVGAIATNILMDFPAAGVWIAILAGNLARRVHWRILEHPLKGSFFLLSLVMAASMMPVEKLPAASWQTACGLGFLSAVFDNIPLTKLALDQGGYDWSFTAYAVGFGGSMIWFGSSAGVAVSTMFPQAKSVAHWLRHGWHVALGYVVGFFVMLSVAGWNPHAPHREEHKPPPELRSADQPHRAAPAADDVGTPVMPAP